jgi:ssDNA-binding Zn-finger/Zn-ribbon topoisomerase 1
MLTYSYGAKAPIMNAELVNEQMWKSHRYYNKLVSLEKDRRTCANLLEKEDVEGRSILYARANELERAYRSTCGVFWGTYLIIEDAVKKGKSTPSGPQFKRWDNQGTVAIQIQGGVHASDLSLGKTRFKLEGEGKHRILWLRIESDKRNPIWAKFPIIWHRDLPDDAVIKWIRVHRHKIGTHYKWKAQFIIETNIKKSSPTKDKVGIDLGWRVRPDGFRVAYWFDGENSGELIIPKNLIDRWKKTEDLRSIRDMHFNQIKNVLCVARKERILPEWFMSYTEHIYAWRSTTKMSTLAFKWRNARFTNDEELYDQIETWRKKDKHLYDWECHQRENVLLSRREIYRLFAIKMCEYKHIHIEDMDMRDFTELPGKDDKPDTYVEKAARPNRFKSALSELRSELTTAAKAHGSIIVKVASEYTTMECAECGHIEEFDAAKSIWNTCPKCKNTWDQDENAAKNIFRALECLKKDKKKISTKLTASERRAKALIKRKETSRKRKEKNK